jgi:hypothetical protein
MNPKLAALGKSLERMMAERFSGRLQITVDFSHSGIRRVRIDQLTPLDKES